MINGTIVAGGSVDFFLEYGATLFGTGIFVFGGVGSKNSTIIKIACLIIGFLIVHIDAWSEAKKATQN